MFEFLKKKVAGFVEKIVGKKHGEAAEKTAEAELGKMEKGVAAALPEAKTMPGEHEKKVHAKPVHFKAPKETPGKNKQQQAVQKTQQIAHKARESERSEVKKRIEKSKEKTTKEEGKEKKVKLSFLTQLKSIFSDEVELGENDISDALDDFEMGLLEGDVALEVAEQIKGELRKELVGKKMKKDELQARVSGIFFDSIKCLMAENTGVSIVEQAKGISARPVKIMFTGPNGSGKTTTIAKVANLLKQNGFGVVIAAADTFRAAAIEQMEIHGMRLGVKVIKGKYGADPTSVAFDAVNHAKAHNADVVLIDTAGRQETNQNLLNELKKMARVIGPELKIYVGESIAGNAVIEQVDSFNKELKLDGIILTKLDCDAKGGTLISISKVTKVPVLYVTTGQRYGDIEPFNAERIAKNIVG